MADKSEQGPSKHDLKQQRRAEKQKQQQVVERKDKGYDDFRKLAIKAVIGLVLVALAYLVYSSLVPGNASANTNAANDRNYYVENFNLRSHTGSLALHIHPHLEIEVNGLPYPVPANIGISAAGMRALHTHETDGTIHIETPVPIQFQLVDFFTVWSRQLSNECVLDYCADEDSELVAFVNGEQFHGDITTIPLKDKDQIKLVYRAK